MRSNPSETSPQGRGLSLWERINRDPRYLEAKHEIQRRYGLPLPFDMRWEPKKWSDWLGYKEAPSSERAERGRLFMEEVHALLKKFEVPDAWYTDFIAEIASRSSQDKD
jgi:hypothetical protein